MPVKNQPQGSILATKRGLGVFVALVMCAGFHAACGGVQSDLDLYDSNLTSFCEKMVACQVPFLESGTGSVRDCTTTFGGAVLSEACFEGVDGASCAELVVEISPVFRECYPLCSTESRTCQNDQIIACIQGARLVVDCVTICKYRLNTSYSGVCGRLSPDGLFTAEEVICWCE